MSAAEVTVSIVNHENREAVLESLGALAADPFPAEVLVVDNVSTDGSAQAIRARFPDVEVIERSERAGYGANHNVALARARSAYVLLLNDDARVRPGALAALRDALERDRGAAVAAPAVVGEDGTPEPTLWPAPSLAGDLRDVLRPRTARPGEAIGWVTGCALMVRRDAVRAIGGFDEGFFMYMEEIDLCTRLRAAGHRIVHVPQAEVVHEGQLSTGAESPERAVEISRARRRYWDKHYGPLARALARAAVGAQLLALAAAQALRGRPARARAIEGAGLWADLRRPGLRERAELFNRERRA